jgi:RNA polymerase primary sigma factor
MKKNSVSIKTDILQDLIFIGRQRGMLTYDDIHNALPSDFFSADEIESFIDLLHDVGVPLTDNEEAACNMDRSDQQTYAYERTEDLVQTYFHSMGDIPVLSKDEETEIAKSLIEGKELITDIISALPLYRVLRVSLNGRREGEERDFR